MRGILLPAILLNFILSSCSLSGGLIPGGSVETQPQHGRPKLASSSVTLMSGETKDLAGMVRDLNNGGVYMGETEWSVRDNGVVRESRRNGFVEALVPGKTFIVISFPGTKYNSLTLNVEVKETSSSVESIKVFPSSAVMKLGEERKFTASVALKDGQVNGNVTWASSDNTILVVNATNGNVRALRVGFCTIIASYTVEPDKNGLAYVSVADPLSGAAQDPKAPIPTPTPRVTASPLRIPAPQIDLGDTLGGVRGVVAESDWTPIPNATVTTSDGSVVLTSDYGVYYFLAKQDPVKVFVAKEGFVPKEATLDVVPFRDSIPFNVSTIKLERISSSK